ncbi:CheR family methyltransferase [Pseudooceanicola sp. LIPI14-2-Ac024]|uniref:CheR family methyltransferase n=1 Tax=Pseudooceanicola sp. LIPI14-2-Ac024 TaxID=3344875 RepID=UPI0035D0D0A5
MSETTVQSAELRPMSEEAFGAISRLARVEAGLVLPPGKATMVQSRLRKRLREIGLKDLNSYSKYVCSDEGVAERRFMISALTTNVSHFFRESHHFAMLRDRVLPPLIDRARAGGRVRIWSAGCSSGQEPYSIAMAVLQAAPDMAQRDVLILGSDIDPKILAMAEEACYSGQQVSGIPPELRGNFLQERGDSYRVAPQVARLVRFRELNLLRPWPMKGQFDVIFCRNVVIYFDQPTQSSLWPRFHQALAPGGWLFVGHSERISDDATHLYLSMGQTAYRAAGPGG